MLAAFVLWLLQDCFVFLGYVSGRTSFPQPLPPAEEKACIQAVQEGDRDARNKLVEHNLRLVAHIAKKYTAPGLESDDLISIGTIGLIKAVSTFKPQTGTQLATYASRCIENEILMCLRASKKYRNDISLGDPVGVDHDGNEINLLDILGTDCDMVENKVCQALQVRQVLSLMQHTLSDNERLVLELRYGLLDGHCRPQREIAARLGISRSYVSRIEKHAVEKLIRALEHNPGTGKKQR